jgi:hypothetical protein
VDSMRIDAAHDVDDDLEVLWGKRVAATEPLTTSGPVTSGRGCGIARCRRYLVK